MPDPADPSGLRVLGSTVRGSITADQLETFPAPTAVSEVVFTTDELTAFCPITGQPDSYRLVLTYTPDGKCVESKALKLYLHGFRDKGMFAEGLADLILTDIVAAAEPATATVRLEQSVRGGLTLTATATYQGPLL